MMTKHTKTVVLGISASIAAYRMSDLILDLKEEGLKVIPILSKDAHHFVTPLTIQSLAGSPVYQDLMAVPGRTRPIHTEIAREADVLVLSPASADLIARVSLGLADDLLSCTVLACDAPVIVVPAMNDKMYANAATQENLGRLKKRGYRIVRPVKGKLVCSDVAMGHIADNKRILNEIRTVLKMRPSK